MRKYYEIDDNLHRATVVVQRLTVFQRSNEQVFCTQTRIRTAGRQKNAGDIERVVDSRVRFGCCAA